MQGSGFLNLDLPFTTTANQVSSTWIPEDNFPSSIYDEQLAIMVGSFDFSDGIGLSSMTGSTYTKYRGTIGMMIAKYEDGELTSNVAGIKPSNALSLDLKLDDGEIASGLFYSYGTIIDNPNRRNCLSSTSYNLDYDSDHDGCTVMMLFPNL